MVKKTQAQEESLFSLLLKDELLPKDKNLERKTEILDELTLAERATQRNRNTICAGCWEKFIVNDVMNELEERISDDEGHWFHPWCAPTEGDDSDD